MWRHACALHTQKGHRPGTAHHLGTTYGNNTHLASCASRLRMYCTVLSLTSSDATSLVTASL